MKTVVLVCTLVAAFIGSQFRAQAADNPPAQKASTPAAKVKQMPFHGNVGSVDVKANTLTLKYKTKSRTFQCTKATRIKRDGKPIKLEQVKAGERVGGLARATPNGGWEVVSLNAGLKPVNTKAKAKASAESTEQKL